MMEPTHYPESKKLTRQQLAENLDYCDKSEGKYFISVPPNAAGDPVFSKVTHSHFCDLNDGDGATFSLTGLPSSQGFKFNIQNVRITPVTHTSFKNMPEWLKKLLVFCGLKLSGQ